MGHHLMRVRIRKSVFGRLQEVADEETDRTGEHITVSDLVRSACYNFLLVHDAIRRLEGMLPPSGLPSLPIALEEGDEAGEEGEEGEAPEDEDEEEEEEGVVDEDDEPVRITLMPLL